MRSILSGGGRLIAALALTAAVATGCGGGSGAAATANDDRAADQVDGRNDGSIDERIDVVVTTSVWGAVVTDAFGSLVNVTTLMGPTVDPHHFALSVKQAAEIERADLVVANGAGLEADLGNVLDAAADNATDGGVFYAADQVELHQLDLDGASVVDPHIWLDPVRVKSVVAALGDTLGELGVTGAVDAAASYGAQLDQLDTTLTDSTAAIPADRRVLVTDHDSLSYFANRYGFRIVGTIVESVTTGAEPSTAQLTDLAQQINTENVPAIFVESTESTNIADALSQEVGHPVAVVPLTTGALGDSATYVDFMTDGTQTIVDALT